MVYGESVPARAVTWPRISAAFLAAAVLALCAAPPACAARKAEPLPWTLRLDVRWGDKKNRDAYRSAIRRAILAQLLERACFESISEQGIADFVLKVEINDMITEQEYASTGSPMFGQGQEHQLRRARVTIDLDYWLLLEDGRQGEIASGHLFREITREPVAPTDPVEARALEDLIADASRWIARSLCDRKGRLASKARKALADSTPQAR